MVDEKRIYNLELTVGDLSDIADGLRHLAKVYEQNEEDLRCCWGNPDDLYYSKHVMRLYAKFKTLWIEAVDPKREMGIIVNKPNSAVDSEPTKR